MQETTKTASIKKRDPALLVRGVTKVASLPTIFIKLDEAINSPRTTNKDLAKIINEDTAMAARLLRIANSALYNFPAKIDTVTHAITVIGTNQLRDLVLACSVIRMFGNVPEDLVSMESFWRHSIACGIAARALAALRREANVERYFVAGLLHDIGRLIIFMEITEDMSAVIAERARRTELLFKLEHELLGFDHAKLGGLLLKAWQLPERLEEAVTYHHHPQRAKKFPVEAALIHVADIIANALRLGSSGEIYVPPINQPSWESLGLAAGSIAAVTEQLEVQYNDAVTFIMGD
jgi:putative nucleotidyltransferase with HDIG domain